MYCTNMQSCVSSTHGGRASCRIAQCVASYAVRYTSCLCTVSPCRSSSLFSLSSDNSQSMHDPTLNGSVRTASTELIRRDAKDDCALARSRGSRGTGAMMSDLTIYNRPESEMIATVRSDCATRYWRRLPALCVVLLARGVATSCAHCSVPRWPSAARCPSRRPRSARRPMRSPRRLESRT